MDSLQKACKNLSLDKLPCPIYFTSKNLKFFEVAAFFQNDQESWIEIKSNRWLKWLGYDPEKILTHELVHACRKNFQDSIYEEMIAYHFSNRAYQRFLGPALSEKGMMRCLILFCCFPLLEGFLAALAILPLVIGMLGYLKIYLGFKKVVGYLKTKNVNYSLELLTISQEEIERLAKKTASSIWNF